MFTILDPSNFCVTTFWLKFALGRYFSGRLHLLKTWRWELYWLYLFFLFPIRGYLKLEVALKCQSCLESLSAEERIPQVAAASSG